MRFPQSNTLNTYILLKSKRNMTSDKNLVFLLTSTSLILDLLVKNIYLFGVTKIVEGFIFDFQNGVLFVYFFPDLEYVIVKRKHFQGQWFNQRLKATNLQLDSGFYLYCIVCGMGDIHHVTYFQLNASVFSRSKPRRHNHKLVIDMSNSELITFL